MALSKDQKLNIAEEFATGNVTKAGLAREYGVSPRTIGRVVSSMVKNPNINKTAENPVDADIWRLFSKSKMGKQKIADKIGETVDYINSVIKRFRNKKGTTDKIVAPKKTITDIPTYIITSKSITISFNGSDVVINKDDDNYRKAFVIISNAFL